MGSGEVTYPLPAVLDVNYSDIQLGLDPNEEAVTSLDLVFCIDTTDGMADDISAIRGSMTEVTDYIASHIPDFRIA
ncbi:MAG: hypothetical protein ACYS21_06555, partial [Planctomycetota bacterium]